MDTKKIFEGFTKSYIDNTRNLLDITFGFLLDGKDWWTISINKVGNYTITCNKPEIPTFYVITTNEILEKIYLGKMHFLTAAGRANMSDYAPLDFKFLNNFTFDEKFDLLDFAFHFFMKDNPAKILFGKDYARIIHGGYAIPMVYKKGLRTAWYRVEKGMIINEKEEDQKNPFDTFVIGIKGKGIAKLDGIEYLIHEGVSYLIPKNTKHSFFSDYEEGLEFIIIMYGDGA